MDRLKTIATAAALTLSVSVSLGPEARAANLCVNPGGSGGCFAAINDAVAAARNKDVIDVAAGTYSERVQVPARKGVLEIRGAGVGQTTISALAGGPVAAALVVSGPSTTVSLSGLTLRDGAIGLLVGGARATVDGCEMTANVQGLTLTTGEGAYAKVTLRNSSVTANAPGGGIEALNGRLHIERSTIAGNDGGGISGGILDLTIDTSTISGNTGSFVGGVTAYGRKTRISRSTIVGNSGGSGGGVYVVGIQPGLARLQTSIVAGNSATTSGGPDCQVGKRAALRLSAANLIGDPTECAFVSDRNAVVLNGDPLVGALADNGGPTQTQALLPGSPAIGVLTAAPLCRPVDQRGFARTAPCDLGAYEAP